MVRRNWINENSLQGHVLNVFNLHYQLIAGIAVNTPGSNIIWE